MKNLFLVLTIALFATSCCKKETPEPQPFDVSGVYELLDKTQIPEGWDETTFELKHMSTVLNMRFITDNWRFYFDPKYTGEHQSYMTGFMFDSYSGWRNQRECELKIDRNGNAEVKITYEEKTYKIITINPFQEGWVVTKLFNYNGPAKKIK